MSQWLKCILNTHLFLILMTLVEFGEKNQIYLKCIHQTSELKNMHLTNITQIILPKYIHLYTMLHKLKFPKLEVYYAECAIKHEKL